VFISLFSLPELYFVFLLAIVRLGTRESCVVSKAG